MQNLARTPDRIDALAEAFTAAEYVVDTHGGDVVIRVGEPTPALDRLLGNRPWAVVTAHNPDGRRYGAKANASAQKSLESDLRELQPESLLSVTNRDPAGDWPDEAAWLFTPRNMFEADRLAEKFGQRAILIGQPGAPARLRIYDASRDAPGTAPGANP